MILVPPPPPATVTPPEAVYDTECYPNYWLLKIQEKASGRVITFRLYAGQCLSPEERARILTIFEAFRVISFNGNHYDVPMITAALSGYSCEQLKWLNDRIIVDKVKPWELNLPKWRPADHIDIKEVCPGAGSQKLFAGRIHYRTMRDLPYSPSTYLSPEQMQEVDVYCENDLGQLTALYDALRPQIKLREGLGARYGMDLRSKSDAQIAEAVLRRRCEQTAGRKLEKQEIDWNLKFRLEVPEYVSFATPQLQAILATLRTAVFGIKMPASMRGHDDGEKGKCVDMPPELRDLKITIGLSTYTMGIGGLHSCEKSRAFISDSQYILRDSDVASYYPKLILNSGKYPPALGEHFRVEYDGIRLERLDCKALAKKLEKAGFIGTVEYVDAKTGDDGGKIMINGTFGKTGSPFSILFAPEMLINTTIPGQLSLLMLIEWHELYGINVVSANTDGVVIRCPRDKVHISDFLIKEWEKRTGLEMETVEYMGIYSKDVNNYFAVKSATDVKRKGEYAKSSLMGKKSPDVEICSDAVAEYLAKGTPLLHTIASCRDIRKFVTIQKVDGGAVKMWGDGPRKDAKVRDMVPVLERNGWTKSGRQWLKCGVLAPAATAYAACFAPQTPEYLGKVIRWYYSTEAPGPIVYERNGNTVGGSWGGHPLMTLPDEFPANVDYAWYLAKAQNILKDIGLVTDK